MPRGRKSSSEAQTAKATGRGRKKLVKGDAQYPIYDPSASRNAYKVGDIVKFPQVRDWLNKGELVEAYGKVVGAGVFDKTVPYIEVSFAEVKKLNKHELGSDIRKFILEYKG